MTNDLVTYALFKTLYDEGKEYLDAFWPFAVMSTPHEAPVPVSSVQKSLSINFNIHAPMHVIEILLSIADRKHLVTKKQMDRVIYYKLTELGKSYVCNRERTVKIEKRISLLIASIIGFFKEYKIDIQETEIKQLLDNFVVYNLGGLIECFNHSMEPKEPALRTAEKQSIFLEYVKTAEEKDHYNYTTLEDMIKGSIISSLLYYEEPEKIGETTSKKFKDCEVYLDTNFLLSFLGMHLEEFKGPAVELFDLLKENGITTKIFNFTEDEICYLLKCYVNEPQVYPRTIKIKSLFAAMKTRNLSRTDIDDFITNIDKTLENYGIVVESRNISLLTYSVDLETRKAIEKYKPNQELHGRNHDIAAIQEIKKIRGRDFRRLEDSKAFFLTSDIRLSKYNLSEHNDNSSVCEVILDRILTNILWLKNPKTKPPLNSIISAHSTDLFVDRTIWRKFYESLIKLKLSGEVKDDEIATLFFNRFAEEALRSLEDSDSDKITPPFTLNIIEKAQEKKELAFENLRKGFAEKERENENELKVKQDELDKEKNIREAIEKILKDKEKDFFDSLQQKLAQNQKLINDISAKVRKQSEKEGTIILSTIFTVAFFAIIVSLLYMGIPIAYIGLILACTGIGGITGIISYARRKNSWLVERLIKKKMKELGL